MLKSPLYGVLGVALVATAVLVPGSAAKTPSTHPTSPSPTPRRIWTSSRPSPPQRGTRYTGRPATGPPADYVKPGSTRPASPPPCSRSRPRRTSYNVTRSWPQATRTTS